MAIATVLRRMSPDWFTSGLILMVALASVLPCEGQVAAALKMVATVMIGLLFFLQGARLSPKAVLEGLVHWRLQLLILGATYLLFPVLGLAFHAAMPTALSPALWAGVLFLCVLPSTVQSSVALTSIGRGNIAAAVCAATGSNLLGILITPLFVSLLVSTSGTASGGAGGGALKIVEQLLLPFILGQMARPWISAWVSKHKLVLSYLDRSSILLVVYTAFSAAVVGGIWKSLDPSQIGMLVVVDLMLFLTVLATITLAGRALGFRRSDEVTLVFCGSNKSLASGIPMANVLFPLSAIGTMVLPLMIFHQLQLILCAYLARLYASRREEQGSAAVG